MPFTNTTPNYGLPQYVAGDKPTILGDLNNAYLEIDSVMKQNAVNVSDALSTAGTAKTTADSALLVGGNNSSAIVTLTNTLSTTNTNLGALDTATSTFATVVLTNTGKFSGMVGGIQLNKKLNIMSVNLLFTNVSGVALNMGDKLCSYTPGIIPVGNTINVPGIAQQSDGFPSLIQVDIREDGIYWLGGNNTVTTISVSSSVFIPIID